jgi:hypothetical protein
MKNFDRLAAAMEHLTHIEDGLKALRNLVGTTTQARINEALRIAGPFRDSLYAIDKAMENTRP